MRICFILGAMNIGGVQSFVLNLGQFLVGNGDEVTVLVTRRKGKWWGRLAKENLKGVCLRQSNFFSPVTHSLAIAKFIKKQKFDAVILNHAREGQIGMPLFRNQTLTIPVLHNDTLGIRKLAFTNWKHWHYLFATSPKLYLAAASQMSAEKVVQINYPVAMPSRDAFQIRSAWQPKLRLVYVGRLHDKQKGVLILPEILRECVANDIEVTLKIIGEGKDRDEMQEALNRDGNDGLVTFVGSCSPEVVRNHLLESHVLLMPSRYEGLGIVAVEAQACGCVPIATLLPGVTDHSIQNDETGFLVDTLAVNQIVKRIACLSKEKVRWQEMSRAGRSNVEQAFGIETVGTRFRDFLASHTELSPKPQKGSGFMAFLLGTSIRDWIPNWARQYVHGDLT